MNRAHRALVAFTLALAPAMPGPALAGSRIEAEDAAANRALYLVLIRQARLDGRARAALAYLDDFDRRHPADREAAILRVNCLLDLGQVETAGAVLARVGDGGPGAALKAEAQAVRGHVAAARGDWPEAVEAYRAAVAADPTNALTRNAYGYALVSGGHPREAVEALQAARDLAPGEAVVRNNLALALYASGRTGEGEALLATVPGRRERSALRERIMGEAARIAARSRLSGGEGG